MDNTSLRSGAQRAWRSDLEKQHSLRISITHRSLVRAIDERIQGLSRKLEDYINLQDQYNLYEVHVYWEPHIKFYTAIVKVLDRRSHQVASIWIREDYERIPDNTCIEFRNLTITPYKED